jgi:hypothetical protein
MPILRSQLAFEGDGAHKSNLRERRSAELRANRFRRPDAGGTRLRRVLLPAFFHSAFRSLWESTVWQSTRFLVDSHSQVFSFEHRNAFRHGNSICEPDLPTCYAQQLSMVGKPRLECCDRNANSVM